MVYLNVYLPSYYFLLQQQRFLFKESLQQQGRYDLNIFSQEEYLRDKITYNYIMTGFEIIKKSDPFFYIKMALKYNNYSLGIHRKIRIINNCILFQIFLPLEITFPKLKNLRCELASWYFYQTHYQDMKGLIQLSCYCHIFYFIFRADSIVTFSSHSI